MMRASLTRTLLAGAVVAAGVLVPAAPAAAHVTITPTTVTAGGRATFTVKVPNEREGTATVRVELTFPENAALTSVSLRPVPGWTATVHRRSAPDATTPTAGAGHDAGRTPVTGIVWQSDTGVRPGEFQTFDVATGPLPDEATTLVFKAVQTYSDGEVVRWIETPQPGAPAPDHPAMVITVSPASPPAPTPAAAPAEGGSTLAAAALVIALLALLAALGALARRRPTATPPATTTPAVAQPTTAGKR